MDEANSMDKEEIEVGEIAYAATYILAKGFVQAIPIVGGVVAEYLGVALAPPLSKRGERILESIVTRLVALEKTADGLKAEELAQNDAFVSTFMSVYQIALRSHQEEKPEALRSAVLNAALPEAPDDDVQRMFLNLVDVFTPWHIRLLKVYDDPEPFLQSAGIHEPLGQYVHEDEYLKRVFSDWEERREFYRRIRRDLVSQELISGGDFWEPPHVFNSRTTDWGKQFLAFITSPL